MAGEPGADSLAPAACDVNRLADSGGLRWFVQGFIASEPMNR